MAFTAKDVQTLREMTGVGMMDCKKALTDTDGDMDKAVELLREKGMAAAAKKADRIAAEGVCAAFVADNGVGAVVEVNSETDFVAKNTDFQTFVLDVAKAVAINNPADVEALKNCTYPGSTQTVGAALQDKVLTIGENLQIRRFDYSGAPVNAAYVHMGGKIAVLVHMDVSDNLKQNPAVVELGRDVAMQVAAMRPLWLCEKEADADTIAKEREILEAQVRQDEKNASKPAQVIEKIVEGRVRKYLAEVCLLNQTFVKENSLTVAQYVEQKAKELGGTITVTKYTRFEKGEGIAKREDDFAAEVAKMIG